MRSMFAPMSAIARVTAPNSPGVTLGPSTVTTSPGVAGVGVGGTTSTSTSMRSSQPHSSTLRRRSRPAGTLTTTPSEICPRITICSMSCTLASHVSSTAMSPALMPGRSGPLTRISTVCGSPTPEPWSGAFISERRSRARTGRCPGSTPRRSRSCRRRCRTRLARSALRRAAHPMVTRSRRRRCPLRRTRRR